MTDNESLQQLHDKLDEVNHRLEDVEQQMRPHGTKPRGDMAWIWALVPIAAIIMWGLANILR